MSESRVRNWRVDLRVLPKQGVNDPEGQSVLGGLHGLGYADVSDVAAGRFFHVWIQADSETTARERVALMADQLLANPVIQRYEIEQVIAEDGPRMVT